MSRPCILLTNDDGIEARGLHALIRALHARGFPLMVLAPANEQSASGMRLTLHRDLTVTRREDVLAELDLNSDGPLVELISVDASPCDAVILALEELEQLFSHGVVPALCVSGINHGPNVSIDVLHSGTVAAARQAAVYGIPAISTSLGTFDHDDYSHAVEASLKVVEAAVDSIPLTPANRLRPNGIRGPDQLEGQSAMGSLRMAFHRGDVMLNVNCSGEWNGSYQTTRLGARWYRGAIEMSSVELDEHSCRIGAKEIVLEPVEAGDADAIASGSTSVTTLATWPQTHPLAISEILLQAALEADSEGLPRWLTE